MTLYISSPDELGRRQFTDNTRVFQNSQTEDAQPAAWTNTLVGTGAVNYEADQKLTQLSTGGGALNASAARQSVQTFAQSAGKGFRAYLVFGVQNSPNGVRRRVGFFSATDGIFLESQGLALSLVQRTSLSGSLVETRVSRGNWNLDPLNEEGPSGEGLNFKDPQQLVIDFQWEGNGRCQVGFLINGKITWAHTFENGGSSAALWTSVATLPLRYEITNTAEVSGAQTLAMVHQSVEEVSALSALQVTAEIDKTGLATEATVTGILAALEAQYNLAATLWTDNSGAYYVRRDTIEETTGTITVAFTDPAGAAATPGAGLRPAATESVRTIVQASYDVITNGTGYTVGDVVLRINIINENTTPVTVTSVWLNATTGAVITPTLAHLQEAGGDLAQVLGSVNDAMAGIGAIGSISAKLRRVTQGLEDLKTMLALPAAQTASAVLHNGAMYADNGTAFLVAGYSEVVLSAVDTSGGGGSGALFTVEASLDSTNGTDGHWFTVDFLKLDSSRIMSESTASGLYRVGVAGLKWLRTPLIYVDTALITITALATLAQSQTPIDPAFMGEFHLGEVSTNGMVTTVTLTLDTAIYAAGDVLADTQPIGSAMRVNRGTGYLESVVIIDKNNQKAALTLLILKSNVSVGAENGPPTWSATDALEVLCEIPVATGDYTTYNNIAIATLTLNSTPKLGAKLQAANASTDLYIAAVNGSGTPTYAADGISLNLGFARN
jgi:hypothetical protein